MARVGGPPGERFARARAAASVRAALRVGAEEAAVEKQRSEGGGGVGEGGGGESGEGKESSGAGEGDGDGGLRLRVVRKRRAG